MGPDADCLALARNIKENWPNFTGDEYALAYTIQAFIESRDAAQAVRSEASEGES